MHKRYLFRGEWGTCKQCGHWKWIVVKSKYSCQHCHKPPKAIKKKPHRNAVTESAFRREVWDERPHVCENCNKPLGNILKAIFISHLLPKGAWPALRLVKDNVTISCEGCHARWENRDRENMRIYKIKESVIQEMRLKYQSYARKI